MDTPRPPLRALMVLALLALVITYETNPNFQSWCNYKFLQAKEWVRYGREWIAYKRRRAEG